MRTNNTELSSGRQEKLNRILNGEIAWQGQTKAKPNKEISILKSFGSTNPFQTKLNNNTSGRYSFQYRSKSPNKIIN